MRQRLLGRRTGLRVSEIALGCGTLIDTSSAHQGGRSEELVGAFLAEAGRECFVIGTKYGRALGDDARSLAGRAHPRAMMAQVEVASRPTGSTCTWSSSPMALPRSRRSCAGWICWCTRARSSRSRCRTSRPGRPLRRRRSQSCAVGGRSRQFHHRYHLLNRSIEVEQLPMARAFGFGVLAWSAQARGLLAGRDLGGVPEGLATALRTLAAARNVPPATIAFSWLLSTGALPVVGARSAEQLAPALLAAETPLADEELALIDSNTAVPNAAEQFLGPCETIGITDTMPTAARR